MMKLLIEAVSVGVLVVVVGTLVSKVIILFMQKNPTTNLNNSRKYYMELGLFLTGVIVHLLCEITGINKWYCKHGNACSK